MRINKLYLENFKQYKKSEITFPDGLLGLVGKNGAGKSSIFEGIYFALYGKFNLTNDKMKNDHADAKESIVVSLSFTDDNINYKVVREYRGKNLTAKAELFINDNDVPDIIGVSEVNKKITKVLKIDAANFKNSYFSEQKEVTALMDLKIGERQKQLRKMLGLEKLDKLEERIKEELKVNRIEVENYEKQVLSNSKLEELNNNKEEAEKLIIVNEENLEKVKNELNTAKDLYDTIKKSLVEMSIKRDKYNEYEKKLAVNKNSVKSVTENINNIAQQLELLNKEKEELTELLPNKHKYLELEKEYEELLKIKAVYTEKVNLKNRLTEKFNSKNKKDEEQKALENELNKYSDIDNQLEKNKIYGNDLEKLLAANEKIKIEITSHINTLKQNVKEKSGRKIKLEKIGINSNCPECNRPLDEIYYTDLVKSYEQEIQKSSLLIEEKNISLNVIENEIIKNKNNQKDLAAELLRLSNKLRDKKNLLKDIEKLKVEIADLLQEMEKGKIEFEKFKDVSFNDENLKTVYENKESLKILYQKAVKIETRILEIPNNIAKKTENEEYLTALINDEKSLQNQLSSIGYNDQEYINLQAQRDEKEKIVEEIKDKLNSIEKELIKVKNEKINIETIIRKNDELVIEVETKKKNYRIKEKLVQFIKDFKSKLTSTELPEISNLANKLFFQITKGRYTDLKINEDFEFTVIRDDIKVPIETLSGGEKDLASICLRIAISKRIAALSGRMNMGFLALDEVFGSQDQSRREELVNTLQAIANDFKQIFVVTHNQDVEEIFPSRLLIRKNGNFSSIELLKE